MVRLGTAFIINLLIVPFVCSVFLGYLSAG
jgi:hypothetical protein